MLLSRVRAGCVFMVLQWHSKGWKEPSLAAAAAAFNLTTPSSSIVQFYSGLHCHQPYGD
jgi:hypothetical protein